MRVAGHHLLSVSLSWSCALAGSRAKTATSAPALPRPFALFWRHACVALIHTLLNATADIGAARTVSSKSAKEDPAERQNSKPLPERYLPPAEQARQQPVPQAHHYFA